MAKQYISYSEKLKDPRWQKKRLEILNRDNFTCQQCKNSTRTLHVHHIKYSKGEPWEVDNSDLITCCENCHLIIEYFKGDLTIHSIKENKCRSIKNKPDAACYFLYVSEIDDDDSFHFYEMVVYKGKLSVLWPCEEIMLMGHYRVFKDIREVKKNIES